MINIKLDNKAVKTLQKVVGGGEELPSDLIIGTLVDDPKQIGQLLPSMSISEINNAVQTNLVALRYETGGSVFYAVCAPQVYEQSTDVRFEVNSFAIGKAYGWVCISASESGYFYFDNGAA